MIARTAADFAEAVSSYRFDDHAFPPDDLAAARASVVASQMLVVGEAHGMRATPSVLYTLARELDTCALAFEWSHEELDEPLQAFVRGEPFGYEHLWSLPPAAEVFGGDGRFTAGHVALLERLRREGRLEQAIAFDRLDPDPPVEWQVREREMAERLLAEWNGAPLLVVTGAFHAQLEGEAMAARLARLRPGLASAVLDYGHAGPAAPIRLRIADRTAAVVPGRASA